MALKLAYLAGDKTRRSDGRKMVKAKFLSLLQEHFLVGLKKIRMEQVWHELPEAIGKALNCQNGERVKRMPPRELMGNKLSFGCLNEASYVQIFVEWHARYISVLPQPMLPPSLCVVQLYSYALMLLENCRQKKLMSALRKYNRGMYVAYYVQLMMIAWNACTWRAELGPSQIHCKGLCFTLTKD